MFSLFTPMFSSTLPLGSKALNHSGSSYWESSSHTCASATRVLLTVCPGSALPLLKGTLSAVFKSANLSHLHSTPSLLSQYVWTFGSGSNLQTLRHSENSREKWSIPSKRTEHWLSIWPLPFGTICLNTDVRRYSYGCQSSQLEYVVCKDKDLVLKIFISSIAHSSVLCIR